VQPATWQAFWRTAVEGHDPRQAARDLGLTLAAVYLAKSRVMARLRALIRETQDGE
jgi:RNA polymerase sigma-70 factor (ECF subfamily)